MYKHNLKTFVCEDTGKHAQNIFTDHSRPGCYNACRHCSDDKRTIAETLKELNDKRGRT